MFDANAIPGMGDEPTREREHCGAIYVISEAHPEADRYPWMSDDELQELADSIGQTVQEEPIYRLPDGRIVDGRNRELACKIAGVEPVYALFTRPEAEIRGFVRRRNALRRHLSRDLRRELIADALRENPDLSNRAHAAELKVSDHTVQSVRDELESTAQIAQLSERTGDDGKTRTAKPARASKPPATATADEPATTQAGEPVNPFADLMSRVTALATDLTRAVNRGDEYGEKLQTVMRDCGLMDYPPGKNPRVLPLAGVHALLELAGQRGALPHRKNVALVYDRANGSWVPPLTKRRRARKKERQR